jgi:4-amino-4-deoxy-L-arabinose transferase-like glycosyltransferase
MSDGPSRLARVTVFAFSSALCLLGLTQGDLVRNEGLRAALAAEALRTGGWLVPRLHGEPHLTKPPGMSAAIGLCSLPGARVTPVTARLPSAIAGLLLVLLFYRLFSRCLGRRAGLIAAAVLPCSALWLDRAPSAEIDLVQTAWVAGSLACLLRAVEAELSEKDPPPRFGEGEDEGRAGGVSPRRAGGVSPLFVPRSHGWRIRSARVWLWWLAALTCVAGGLFTKWTAPAFFYLTALPFLASKGRLSLLFRLPHLVGASLVAALAVGWLALAAHAAGWQTLLDTLGREALLRLSPGHHPRPYPWDELLAFPLTFLAANLPWSIFALPAMAPSFARLWDQRTRRLLLLCRAWLGANLLFWTLAPGHRPRHLLPAQPAVAALAALVWIAWLTGRLPFPVGRIGARRLLVGLLVAWLVVKLVFVGLAPVRQAKRHPRVGGERLAALVPPGEVLYLRRLKDEGLLFYYGRPARRLPAETSPRAGAWCLLTEEEWKTWAAGPAEKRAGLLDGQGAPLVLVRVGENSR